MGSTQAQSHLSVVGAKRKGRSTEPPGLAYWASGPQQSQASQEGLGRGVGGRRNLLGIEPNNF